MGQAAEGRQLRDAVHDEGAEPRRKITAQELDALVNRIDLGVAKHRKRYQRKCSEAS